MDRNNPNNNTAPYNFVKLINQMKGEKLQQGYAVVELFADSFAIAMMQTFDWAKYDPFKSIDPMAKEIVRRYMDRLITQTVF
ncbi:MAG: hypothetical protein RR639_08295 [Hydrogenoanaerobacterium sp.]